MAKFERALGTSRDDMERDTMRPDRRVLPVPVIEHDASGRAYFLGVPLTTAEDIKRDTFRRKDYPRSANSSELDKEEGKTA